MRHRPAVIFLSFIEHPLGRLRFVSGSAAAFHAAMLNLLTSATFLRKYGSTQDSYSELPYVLPGLEGLDFPAEHFMARWMDT